MRESVSACCALVLLCGGLWTLCTACESTKKTRKEQVAKAAAAAPAHKPQPVKSTRPRPTPQEQITAAFDGFARTTAEKGTRRVKRFVVLPFAEPSARTTVLSKHLAGMMADALRSRGLQRLERENLAELFAEARMNEMTGEGNIKTARVMGADILVVGEYAQAGGRIAMKARAVAVADTRVLHEGRWSVPSDKELRAMAFRIVRSGEKRARESPAAGDVGRVWEENGFILIAEEYIRAGASEARLLDRVKQKIRRRLFAYCRRVLLVEKSADDLEDLFKRGEVEDARFDPGKVYLKMKFRKPS